MLCTYHRFLGVEYQEIIQVRKSMLSVQTSTRKCIDGVKAEIALCVAQYAAPVAFSPWHSHPDMRDCVTSCVASLKAVDTLCVGLKEVLDAKREQLATEMRERRAAMMKLTTQYGCAHGGQCVLCAQSVLPMPADACQTCCTPRGRVPTTS